MARGDHLRAARFGYHHDGIDLGDGRIVHFTPGAVGSKTNAEITISTFGEFTKGGLVSSRPYSGPRDPDVTVERALSRVGDSGYHLAFNNCEHFARWCVTGEHRSEQVVAAGSSGAAGVLAGMSGSVALSVIGSLGYPGVSGAGMMSGLATVGAVVGGGAMAGLGLMGAIPAGVGLALMAGRRFSVDQDLPPSEQRARRAGQVGAVAGGIVGVGGMSSAISSLGIAGVSAAGISSALAGMGAIVGGGMSSGIAIAVAVPVIGVVIGAYLFHWLWSVMERRASLSHLSQGDGSNQPDRGFDSE